VAATAAFHITKRTGSEVKKNVLTFWQSDRRVRGKRRPTFGETCRIWRLPINAATLERKRERTAVRREKTSVSQEDYLKAIWEMLEEGHIPISARLAEELAVTPPAVTAALKRMTRDDLVRVDRSGRIELSRKGRAVAERMALRHQLAEMLLTEVIGLPWARAHDEAERLEHAISPEVELLLLKRFGEKASCPHGVPIRGGVARLREQGAVLMSDLRPKERAEIVAVYEKDGKFLEFLEGLHLRPGAQVEVINREYDETITLRAGGKTMYLGKPATSRIWVLRK
jgi:DtxR family transcriptional regulator, Mn-dependent transcriptional regulator